MPIASQKKNPQSKIKPTSTLAKGLVLGFLLGAASASAANSAAMSPASSITATESSTGRTLFEGKQAIAARMPGHQQVLPPSAARCINCHRDAPDSRSIRGTPALAPRITASLLTSSISRRRGPESKYEIDSFCELVRTGVDPAGVMIEQTMPRYEISNLQCSALWRYLSAKQ